MIASSMEMGIKILNITVGLNCYTGTRNSIIIWDGNF